MEFVAFPVLMQLEYSFWNKLYDSQRKFQDDFFGLVSFECHVSWLNHSSYEMPTYLVFSVSLFLGMSAARQHFYCFSFLSSYFADATTNTDYGLRWNGNGFK